MVPRRLWPALTLALALGTAGPAAAQTGVAALVAADGRAAAEPRLPDFRPPAGDLRRAGEPRRNGLIAAWSVNEDLQVGIGRFEVPDPPRPRTHMERDGAPTSVRPRHRGIAAFGFSLRF